MGESGCIPASPHLPIPSSPTSQLTRSILPSAERGEILPSRGVDPSSFLFPEPVLCEEALLSWASSRSLEVAKKGLPTIRLIFVSDEEDDATERFGETGALRYDPSLGRRRQGGGAAGEKRER